MTGPAESQRSMFFTVSSEDKIGSRWLITEEKYYE